MYHVENNWNSSYKFIPIELLISFFCLGREHFDGVADMLKNYMTYFEKKIMLYLLVCFAEISSYFARRHSFFQISGIVC